MSATAFTPGYRGIIVIGSLAIPVLPGAVFTCPENFELPPILGNAYQWNVGLGLQQPTLDLNLAVLDTPNAALGSGLWDLILQRSSGTSFDTASTGTVTFWDGQTGFALSAAKIESVTIGTSKGDNIRMSIRIVGYNGTPGTPCLSTVSSAPAFTPWSNAAVLRFPAAACGSSPLQNTVWGWDLTYQNNHTPNLALDGTQFPVDQNAGMPTCGLTIRNQAADTVPADGTAITITIAGTPSTGAGTTTLTVQNPKNNTPKNRRVDFPRVFREHQFVGLGTAGQDGSGTYCGPLQYDTVSA